MRFLLIAAAVGGLVVLGGCTPTSASAPTPDAPAAAAVDWDARFTEFVAENGERPAAVPFADPQVEAERLAANQDRDWQGVVASYPDAVRPDVAFAHWTSDDERRDLGSDLNRCLVEAGAELAQGTDAEGRPSGVEYSFPPTQEATVAVYACRSLAYPMRPLDGSGAGGWLWDLASEVLVPCLEAHGIPQAALPTREEQVASVYERGFGWVPDFGQSATDVGPDSDAYSACHGELL
ncbi:MAG: hypothetical protein DI534_09265 [Leifsonia xyli]|nr:MAG: hypothetical protein DI534_09265 [Leifsonia xyli]